VPNIHINKAGSGDLKSTGLEQSKAHGLQKCEATLCRFSLLLGILICIAGFGKATASQMSYIFKATGSGSLGPDNFTNAPFTIISTAETTGIMNPVNGIYQTSDLTATISVLGLGLATFVNPTLTVNNENLTCAGFSDPTQNLAILFVKNQVFDNFDLGKPIGPFTGTPDFNLNRQFLTTIGNLSLTAVTNASFQSVIIKSPRIIYYACSQSTNTLIATNCIAGLVYTVQGNINLTTTNWAGLASVEAAGAVATNGLASFNFTVPSNAATMFFRVSN
jgi:hypothetical protein